MVNLEKHCIDVVAICKEVGAYIRQEAQLFSSLMTEEKGLHDLVSYVDKEAERFLVEKLQDLIPGAGFITEENEDREIGPVFNWIIDPLDGTTNFIHKIPTFSISVALARGEELLIGVVYEINRDECFYAVKGGNAYLNGEQINVSATKKLSDSLIGTGLPYRDFDNLTAYLEVLKELMQQTRGIRRIGSAAVDMVYVACGRFDGFFEMYLKNYDMAAGILIIQEAGGEVVDFDGEMGMLAKGNIIAGNGSITRSILEIIKKHFP